MKKIAILDVMVNVITMPEAVAKVGEYVAERRPRFIVTANAEMIMQARQDDELARILNSADMVVPDGAGAVWAARRLGHEMPERVAGCDLVQNVFAQAAAAPLKAYFFGSSPGVAERAAREAEARYPGLKVVGCRDGYFTAADETAIVEGIKKAAPDILLVALGVPKQEKWIYNHYKELGVPVSVGVGGTIDIMAGVVKRAPLWMRKAKLEWSYRLIKQPRRIIRMTALPRFVVCVLKCKKG